MAGKRLCRRIRKIENGNGYKAPKPGEAGKYLVVGIFREAVSYEL